MKLLAIETSGAACSIALSAGVVGGRPLMRHEVIPMQQSHVILPWIDALLREQLTTIHQLDAIAFGCGPGSFTGIRLATSIAQGLAYGSQLPVIPISSLAILAQTAYETLGWTRVFTAVDARMSEIYAGSYELDSNGRMILVQEEQLCLPDSIKWPSGQWKGVGNGVVSIAAKLIEADVAMLPMASALLALAEEKAARGEWIKPQDARPVYLRDVVAQKAKTSPLPPI